MQKKIFLDEEGDQWFLRNQQVIQSIKSPKDDFILNELLDIYGYSESSMSKIKVLEIGCGNGSRLAWLKNNLGADVFGIEPSDKAAEAAILNGVRAQKGTADKLPFDDNFFDVVIFGFCLYLCDREDLFSISSEANRVLRSPGWLLILDFFSKSFETNEYHHKKGLKSFKMDYRSLFSWHPFFDCISHKVRQHSIKTYTDNKKEWISISVLRKFIE